MTQGRSYRPPCVSKKKCVFPNPCYTTQMGEKILLILTIILIAAFFIVGIITLLEYGDPFQ